jgi:hypothetical protein
MKDNVIVNATCDCERRRIDVLEESNLIKTGDTCAGAQCRCCFVAKCNGAPRNDRKVIL